MATKPFQNEEIQQCVDYVPGQRYIVEAQCNTSAPYGDKFDLLFRISILAESKTTCFLHVVFDIKWSPSMNRMLKGMVTKAVEGVSGSSTTCMVHMAHAQLHTKQHCLLTSHLVTG